MIRNSAVYPSPIDAIYDGRPVTILATGDVVGMSPAVQIVDTFGKLDWVSSEDVTVTQRQFLPQSAESLSRLRQQS